ncbi:hypothetical protein NDU88_005724 [Pleurodeles waltl]|uniref:Uncharacterized protein n=1 Tax=Pleurodeles waltl TaxID=8319 RepID=A0AAV7UKB6_PLEWA|nr:hypothetical protein NDU88_005724 [Pleurodeles waltl]
MGATKAACGLNRGRKVPPSRCDTALEPSRFQPSDLYAPPGLRTRGPRHTGLVVARGSAWVSATHPPHVPSRAPKSQRRPHGPVHPSCHSRGAALIDRFLRTQPEGLLWCSRAHGDTPESPRTPGRRIID